MKVLRTISEIRERIIGDKRAGRTIGLVPTMGFLHEGHATLIRHARAASDVVVVSVFVNPIQFVGESGFDRYPRDIERDIRLLEAERVDYLFTPEAREMFPDSSTTRIDVGPLGKLLEGTVRPHYFAGITTVVGKLFNIVQPDRAWFGEKDYQQVLVVKKMVRELSFPIEVIAVPTVRDGDGLALSSRNTYLSPEERALASRIPRALDEAERLIRAGRLDPSAIERATIQFLEEEPLIRHRMVAVRNADDLSEATGGFDRDVVVLVCARLGRTELLDERIVRLKA